MQLTRAAGNVSGLAYLGLSNSIKRRFGDEDLLEFATLRAS
jgi:hypothetical protein